MNTQNLIEILSNKATALATTTKLYKKITFFNFCLEITISKV